MILVIGPLAAGKRTFVENTWGYGPGDRTDDLSVAAPVFCGAEALARGEEELESLCRRLARYPVVIATEVGGGVVPVEAGERRFRERAGRLCCLLAGRAQTVVRVWYSLPQVLKGELP